MEYYNADRVLAKKDINGREPSIIICVGNRTGGKTTAWGMHVLDRFLSDGRQFMLIYRYAYELEGVSQKFFNDLRGLKYGEYLMEDKIMGKGSYVELHLGKIEDENKPVCGYAVALNKFDAIKKQSHVFTNVWTMLFDEFQPESNVYLPNEIDKFMSIYVSVARGNGQMSRNVRVVLISNPVTILNPYYSILGITDRLRTNTKYMRGDGYIFEQLINTAAAKAQAENTVLRAFTKSSYSAYLTELEYLNDNTNFIGKPEGRGRYYMTVIYGKEHYGIYVYTDQNIYYVSDRADLTYSLNVSIRPADHNSGTVMYTAFPKVIADMRNAFSLGFFRFKNAKCKDVAFELLTIR